jgi:hypothetical protein
MADPGSICNDSTQVILSASGRVAKPPPSGHVRLDHALRGLGPAVCAGGLEGTSVPSANNVNLSEEELKGVQGLSCSASPRPRRRRQEAYVRKVVDTVNDLDNALRDRQRGDFTTTAWQYHLIRFIKRYEATKPKQHPVG